MQDIQLPSSGPGVGCLFIFRRGPTKKSRGINSRDPTETKTQEANMGERGEEGPASRSEHEHTSKVTDGGRGGEGAEELPMPISEIEGAEGDDHRF